MEISAWNISTMNTKLWELIQTIAFQARTFIPSCRWKKVWEDVGCQSKTVIISHVKDDDSSDFFTSVCELIVALDLCREAFVFVLFCFE